MIEGKMKTDVMKQVMESPGITIMGCTRLVCVALEFLEKDHAILQAKNCAGFLITYRGVSLVKLSNLSRLDDNWAIVDLSEIEMKTLEAQETDLESTTQRRKNMVIGSIFLVSLAGALVYLWRR